MISASGIRNQWLAISAWAIVGIFGALGANAQTGPSTPVLTPAGGSTTTAFPVTVTCATGGVEIHYTPQWP